MAEPFKNWFSAEMAAGIAANMSRVSDRFDGEVFITSALEGLDRLELKQRSEQFSMALETAMPGSFEDNVAAMLRALHPVVTAGISEMQTDDTGVAGWALMPMMAYIARNGLQKPEFSLSALREMTMRSSSEFDVRPFLRDHPAVTLKIIETWARDENEHVRRLASEGSRPRLPWGIRLHGLIADPAPILPILTRLRDDDSEYVRRSVANSLNDIAKDHPDLVAGIAADWMRGASPERVKLIRHACRTLIKAGHPGTLAVFGYVPADLRRAMLTVTPHQACIGDALELRLDLENAGAEPQSLLIDYVMYYQRANGSHGPKVFKWTETTLGAAPLTLTKTHKLREVTTRRHYPGLHRVEAQVNGCTVAEAEFSLSLEA